MEKDTTGIEQVADEVTEQVQTPDTDQSQPSFAELLKDKAFASEFDKRVSRSIATARERWEQEAKLSAEELAAKQIEDKEKELADRVAAFEQKEFTADIKAALIEQKLPVAFAEVIAQGTTRETCVAVLSEIKKEWDKQLAEALKASARQDTPLAGSTKPEPTVAGDLSEFAKENRKVD